MPTFIALIAIAIVGPDPGTGPPAIQGPSQSRANVAPPLRGDEPVDVQLGFLVLEFSRVDAREESFGLTAFLSMTWHDPRLALPESERDDTGRPRRFRPTDIWTPSLFFPNALDEVVWQERDAEAEVSPDGTVIWGGILSGKFAFVMHLQRFPFDEQILPIRVASQDDAHEVRLVPHPPSIGRSRRVSLTDWDVGEAVGHAANDTYPPDTIPYSHVNIETEIERRSTFYVWRVMVPISFLVMASWMVFWFEPVNLQPQISTSLGLLLSLVTFHFGVDFALPKVTYLSLVEKHAIQGMIFVLSTAVCVTMIHRLVVTERLALALRFQRRARWIMPVAYVVSVIAEFASSMVPAP